MQPWAQNQKTLSSKGQPTSINIPENTDTNYGENSQVNKVMWPPAVK